MFSAKIEYYIPKDLQGMSLKNIEFNNTRIEDELLENVAFNKDKSLVHIRVQQRQGRKSLTTIQGLANDLNLKKIVRYLKRIFSTNGTIIKDDAIGEVIQLQGDQRYKCSNFFVKYKVCLEEEIRVHGF